MTLILVIASSLGLACGVGAYKLARRRFESRQKFIRLQLLLDGMRAETMDALDGINADMEFIFKTEQREQAD